MSVVVTGATDGVHNRLEITKFLKNEKFLSLYVQALQKLFDGDQDKDAMSFFQIGGIHGLPYQPWDGVGELKRDGRWPGYCTHGDVLFPTWHRPYVMLFEQAIQQKAKAIAATYTVDTEAWVLAADQLRQPYWDWAKNAVPPALIIEDEEVSIVKPDGTRNLVPNPFRRYHFQPIPQSFPASLRSEYTYRHPITENGKRKDNVKRLKEILEKQQKDGMIRTDTFKMLTRLHNWFDFSNTGRGDGRYNSSSLEGIHDNIHGLVGGGGGGHMSNTAVAAFDPIFYLHHANVDRLLAFWTALHPGVWVSPGNSGNGSFTRPVDSAVDATTDLTPFRSTANNFWGSSAVQSTAELGYTYPEFNGLDMGNPSAVQTAINAAVIDLYGKPNLSTNAAAPMTGTRSIDTSDDVLAEPVEVVDWTVRLEFKKNEIGQSFHILLFLGQVPEQTSDWLIADNLVGTVTAFVNTASAQCENCRQNQDFVQEGFVTLDDAIIEHSSLPDLDHDTVEPYLKSNLHWRVQTLDDTAVDLESLEVIVVSTALTMPPGATLPVSAEPRRHPRITHGKTGGCRSI